MSLPNAGRWKPGQTGNPNGQPKLPPEVRALRRENTASLVNLVHKYLSMTGEEAAKWLAGPEITQLEETIQGQILKAKEGDAKTFQFLMEVMCGKIPETNPEDSIADKLTPQERLAAARTLIQVLEREAEDEPQASE